MIELKSKIEEIGAFDVVVVGGGVSGIAVAKTCAEAGVKTAVLEKAEIVGGCLTSGHVSPISGLYGKNTFADRIHKLLQNDKPGVCHDIENAKILLTELLDDEKITVYLGASVTDVIKDGDTITHAVFSTQSGLKCVSGKIFVDASGDGVLSFLAGEKTEYGREDGLVQPMSIMFTVENVDINQKIICINEVMDTKLKKGYYQQLCKDACLSGELPPTVSVVRLYQGVKPTERVVNATQVNGLNPLDCVNKSMAQTELRKQMKQVLDFLKNNVEGFENACIKDSSDCVGIRETRRVMGKYVMKAEDLIEGKRQPDVIVHDAEFAIDIHNPNGSGQSESKGLPVLCKPYGAVVPLVNKNLYVAGRCISGTHRAHASYRVMNICLNIGQAVGVASALCVKKGFLPSTLNVKDVQNELINKGIKLFD